MLEPQKKVLPCASSSCAGGRLRFGSAGLCRPFLGLDALRRALFAAVPHQSEGTIGKTFFLLLASLPDAACLGMTWSGAARQGRPAPLLKHRPDHILETLRQRGRVIAGPTWHQTVHPRERNQPAGANGRPPRPVRRCRVDRMPHKSIRSPFHQLVPLLQFDISAPLVAQRPA